VRLLCRELSRETQIEQALVTKQGSELARRAAADGVSVLGTAWDIGLDPRAWWHLRRTVAAFQPDVIHVHDSHGVDARGGRGHGPEHRRDPTSRIPHRTLRLLAPSRPHHRDFEAVRNVLIADDIDSGAVVVVHDGIDVTEVRHAGAVPFDIRGESGIPAFARLAVNAAALTGEKDHRTLIRAAHYARANRPDLHWVIAGEGRLRDSLAAEIHRLGLADRVHLIGHVDRVDALIAAADVFVLTSKREGLAVSCCTRWRLAAPSSPTAAGEYPKSSLRRSWSPPRTRKRWQRKSWPRSIIPHRCPSAGLLRCRDGAGSLGRV